MIASNQEVGGGANTLFSFLTMNMCRALLPILSVRIFHVTTR